MAAVHVGSGHRVLEEAPCRGREWAHHQVPCVRLEQGPRFMAVSRGWSNAGTAMSSAAGAGPQRRITQLKSPQASFEQPAMCAARTSCRRPEKAGLEASAAHPSCPPSCRPALLHVSFSLYHLKPLLMLRDVNGMNDIGPFDEGGSSGGAVGAPPPLPHHRPPPDASAGHQLGRAGHAVLLSASCMV